MTGPRCDCLAGDPCKHPEPTPAEVEAIRAEVRERLRRDGPLPPILHGVLLPVATACGIVSRSRSQTSWAIADARRRAPALLEHLTDDDVLWLLLMRWSP